MTSSAKGALVARSRRGRTALAVVRGQVPIRSLVTILVLGGSLWGQVNTEAMRLAELPPGLQTELGLDASLAAGNSQLLILKGMLRFDHLSETAHSYLIGSRKLGQSDTLIINKGFVHLRQTRALAGKVSIEAYLQKEFNQFIRLKDRNLAGGGLRIRWLEAKSNHQPRSTLGLTTGVGFMWEQERVEEPDDPDDALKNLVRSTNYLVLGWQPNEGILLQMTTYYQPDVRNLKDFRVLLDGGLTFALFGKLTAAIKISSRYDNEPPAGLGLEKYDLELTSGLAYRF